MAPWSGILNHSVTFVAQTILLTMADKISTFDYTHLSCKYKGEAGVMWKRFIWELLSGSQCEFLLPHSVYFCNLVRHRVYTRAPGPVTFCPIYLIIETLRYGIDTLLVNICRYIHMICIYVFTLPSEVIAYTAMNDEDFARKYHQVKMRALNWNYRYVLIYGNW